MELLHNKSRRCFLKASPMLGLEKDAVQEAHRYMESNKHLGKIVLTV